MEKMDVLSENHFKIFRQNNRYVYAIPVDKRLLARFPMFFYKTQRDILICYQNISTGYSCIQYKPLLFLK